MREPTSLPAAREAANDAVAAVAAGVGQPPSKGPSSLRRDLLLRAGYRALLAVPLLRDEQLLGVLLVSRKAPGAFAPETVDLLKTFATAKQVHPGPTGKQRIFGKTVPTHSQAG